LEFSVSNRDKIKFLLEPAKPAVIVSLIGFAMSIVPSLATSSVFYTWPGLASPNYTHGAWTIWALCEIELLPRFVIVPFSITYLIFITLNSIARTDFTTRKPK
jgi:hypothetical protein